MANMHHRVTWEPMTGPSDIIRSSIGGYPILPVGESWPVCAQEKCGQKLALFFQFELAAGVAARHQVVSQAQPRGIFSRGEENRPHQLVPGISHHAFSLPHTSNHAGHASDIVGQIYRPILANPLQEGRRGLPSSFVRSLSRYDVGASAGAVLILGKD